MNENKIKNYFNKNSNYWERFYIENNNLVEAILVERKNIIKTFIIDNFEKNVKILDLGGGTGVMSSELIQSGFNVDMIDISKNMIEQAKQNYTNLNLNMSENKLINEDFLNINFNNKYDIIIALGSFEYQTNYDLNFNKIYNCLNSNGNLIFNLPIERNLGNLFGFSRYVNNFKNLFKSVPHPGLKLKKINELISLINASGFKLDLVKDHGYGDIYILNKILPYILQKKISKLLSLIDKNNKIEFFKSNKIFFTHK